MTQLTFKTNPEEADAIIAGRTVIFRGKKPLCREGDIIGFSVIKQGKSVRHQIDSRSYEVIYVAEWGNAPLQDGFVALNFKEIC